MRAETHLKASVREDGSLEIRSSWIESKCQFAKRHGDTAADGQVQATASHFTCLDSHLADRSSDVNQNVNHTLFLVNYRVN